MRDITVYTIMNAEALAAGTTKTSDSIDLGASAVQGYFSIQYEIEGAGSTVCAAYKVSNDGLTFVQSTEGYAITAATGTTAYTNKTGPAANGKDLIAFTPPPCARIQILLWNVSPTGATVTAKLAVM